eukprot:scaffold1645_cov288-Pavlova_lutheri.AAC.17
MLGGMDDGRRTRAKLGRRLKCSADVEAVAVHSTSLDEALEGHVVVGSCGTGRVLVLGAHPASRPSVSSGFVQLVQGRRDPVRGLPGIDPERISGVFVLEIGCLWVSFGASIVPVLVWVGEEIVPRGFHVHTPAPASFAVPVSASVAVPLGLSFVREHVLDVGGDDFDHPPLGTRVAVGPSVHFEESADGDLLSFSDLVGHHFGERVPHFYVEPVWIVPVGSIHRQSDPRHHFARVEVAYVRFVSGSADEVDPVLDVWAPGHLFQFFPTACGESGRLGAAVVPTFHRPRSGLGRSEAFGGAGSDLVREVTGVVVPVPRFGPARLCRPFDESRRRAHGASASVSFRTPNGRGCALHALRGMSWGIGRVWTVPIETTRCGSEPMERRRGAIDRSIDPPKKGRMMEE